MMSRTTHGRSVPAALGLSLLLLPFFGGGVGRQGLAVGGWRCG